MQSKAQIKTQLKEIYLPTVVHHTAAEIRVTLALTIERLRQALTNVEEVKNEDDLDLFYESSQEFATISSQILDGIRLAKAK